MFLASLIYNIRDTPTIIKSLSLSRSFPSRNDAVVKRRRGRRGPRRLFHPGEALLKRINAGDKETYTRKLTPSDLNARPINFVTHRAHFVASAAAGHGAPLWRLFPLSFSFFPFQTHVFLFPSLPTLP